MKFILLSLLLSSLSFAEQSIRFYRIESLTCRTDKGISIQYLENDPREKSVLTEWSGVRKNFWFDGGKYLANENRSEIAFTGHRPSAGPSLDIWESDYLIRFTGQLPDQTEQQIRGQLLRSVSYLPYYVVDQITCEVVNQSTF